jgi:hypothetical protein
MLRHAQCCLVYDFNILSSGVQYPGGPHQRPPETGGARLIRLPEPQRISTENFVAAGKLNKTQAREKRLLPDKLRIDADAFLAVEVLAQIVICTEIDEFEFGHSGAFREKIIRDYAIVTERCIFF